MPDHEPHQAEWRPLVAFEDKSASYVHGVEAGMIWQRMHAEEDEIIAMTHPENRGTLQAMADAAGYEIEAEPTEVEGWDQTTATRRPHRGGLAIIK